jgi:2-polyprenyl-3-methyl-5-hydroxy-6-metoxy-1,4-benzoquinol methylase
MKKNTIPQPCALCGAEESRELFRITRFARPFPVHACVSCGLIFMKPFFSGPVLASLYKKEYYTGNDQAGAYRYVDERTNRRGFQAVARARVGRILGLLGIPDGRGRSFLDVGCSFGSLLDAAREAGFATTGIDVSAYALRTVRQSGHEAIRGGAETVRLPPGRYAAAAMVEVIEHLKRPDLALAGLYHALAPGGLLLVQTANMDGRQARRAGADYHYFLPGHLHYFSRRTLVALLEKTGFTDVRCFYPCEFGLLPKLRKSRGGFTRLWDYRAWLRIIRYHLASKLHKGERAWTSALVVTARKI